MKKLPRLFLRLAAALSFPAVLLAQVVAPVNGAIAVSHAIEVGNSNYTSIGDTITLTASAFGTAPYTYL